MNLTTEQADKAYEKWLKKPDVRQFVPVEMVARWIKSSQLKHEEIQHATGITVRSVGRIAQLAQGAVRSDYALRIAWATNNFEECNEYLEFDPPGLDGWSESERYCRECGTWFHPHYKRGLCECCYGAWIMGRGQSSKRLLQGDVPKTGIFPRSSMQLV